jgi:hypothetical protein
VDDEFFGEVVGFRARVREGGRGVRFSATGVDEGRQGRPAITERERELFTLTEYTRPVDVNSFRRPFKQSLPDAGVDIQLSMALSGATDANALPHGPAKARQLPESSLSSFCIDLAETFSEDANSNGEFSGFSRCRRADLNRRQRAYESGAEGVLQPLLASIAPGPASVTHTEIAGNGSLLRNSVPKVRRSVAASEAALGAYLRTMADELAKAFAGTG